MNRISRAFCIGALATTSLFALAACSSPQSAPSSPTEEVVDEPVAEESTTDSGEVDISQFFDGESLLCEDLEIRAPGLRDQQIGCFDVEYLDPRAEEIHTALLGSGFYVYAVGGVPSEGAAFVILSTDKTCNEGQKLLWYDFEQDVFLTPDPAAGRIGTDTYTIPANSAVDALASYSGAPFNCA